MQVVEPKVEGVAKTASDMLAVVQAKRTLPNATPRINRLPLELLTLIFQLVQTYLNVFPPNIIFSDGKPNGWLVILHVCHDWRCIALAIPSLWKNIVLTDSVKDHEGLAEWFLHNAGRHVLLSWTISLNYSYFIEGSFEGDYEEEDRKLSANFLDIFAANLHRIESLSIQCAIDARDQADNKLFELITRPMPMLRALDMQLPWSTNVGFLTNLDLSGVTRHSTRSLPLPRVTFAHLSHFSLEHQEPEQRPSLTQFLDFLKANPSLEMICLKNAGPVVAMADLKDVPGPVELPHLHRIQYNIWKGDAMGESDAFYWLLACLKPSEDVTIHLTSPKIPVALRRSKEMYAALARYFDRISTVKLEKMHGNECVLLFHGTHLYVEVPLTTSFFQTKAKGGPYSKVQTLILAENTNKKSPSNLQFLLKSFSGLKRLEVEWAPPSGSMRRSQHPVIRALSGVNIRSKKAFAVGELPCRDIQELVLKCTNFTRVFSMDGEPPHEDEEYYRADGKISRGTGLGLYSLKADPYMGPRPRDKSLAGSGWGHDKLARAFQTGDFRYL
ncbi:hypothetical protein M413DRAFT_177853 [Hebeloma cylindrosporum]|uniref:Uncharacterized protein n=1 Tax=Hebeloma cylindrosporum TaxID=76867 RepID=A0A0C3BUJ6_HEBCY|nr:hypothetical protein M413DRAFT_177853 [Hebeloma cylindrosporum h7]